MKLLSYLIITFNLLFSHIFYVATQPTTTQTHSEISKGGKKKKSGRYKKKKGFLGGIFKGKNDCDCPKH